MATQNQPGKSAVQGMTCLTKRLQYSIGLLVKLSRRQATGATCISQPSLQNYMHQISADELILVHVGNL